MGTVPTLRNPDLGELWFASLLQRVISNRPDVGHSRHLVYHGWLLELTHAEYSLKQQLGQEAVEASPEVKHRLPFPCFVLLLFGLVLGFDF